jgi:hypothetical protein
VNLAEGLEFVNQLDWFWYDGSELYQIVPCARVSTVPRAPVDDDNILFSAWQFSLA